MHPLLHDLKSHARHLQRQATAGEPGALARLRAVPATDEAPPADPRGVQRRHALAAIARELGFQGWPHALAALTTAVAPDDFGTLLYPNRGAAYWNVWSASYDEAHEIRAEHGGYLLVYRRQFFVADRHFVEHLGIDPDDADWERIGRDWARPADFAARERLAAQRVARLLAPFGFPARTTAPSHPEPSLRPG